MASFGRWVSGIRGRLLFLISVPLIALLVVGGVTLQGLNSQAEDLRVMTSERLPLTKFDGILQTSYNAMSRFTFRALAEDKDYATREKSLAEIEVRRKSFEDALTAFNQLPLSPKGRELANKIPAVWKDFSALISETLPLLQKNTAEGDAEAKTILLGQLLKPANELKSLLTDVSTNAEEVNSEIVDKAMKNTAAVKLISLVTLAIGFVLACLIGIVTAARLANALGFIATNIGDGGSQVSSASEQMSAASQQLSAASTESASALQETVASVEELSSMVKINADNAKEAASLSQESRTSAEEGEAEIRKLNTAMGEVAQSSKKIEEIINVIDDIAFQTNLLALNAAVEAARAGDQGKGFAVVAEAVRALAQRSAAAAKDITGLIKESVVKVENGTKVANDGARTLKAIVTSVKKVADLNNEIAAASQEQSNGLVQISKAMNELDQATQRNASSAEETASASEELSGQAITLQDLVQRLAVIIDGNAAGGAGLPNHQEVRRPMQQQRPTLRYPAATRPTLRQATKATVVPMRRKAPHLDPQHIIPMDEEADLSSKVGTAEGF